MVEDIINHHQLVVLDGVTRARDNDADLRYNLETPDVPGYVDIIENTFGLSNVTPFIVPVGQSKWN